MGYIKASIRSHEGGSARQTAFLLIFSIFLYWVSLFVYIPVFSPYMVDLNFSYGMIGMIIGANGLVQIVLRFPLGVWSDLTGRRQPFLIAGLGCAFLSACCLLLWQHPWALGAARLLSGAAASVWVVFTVAYMNLSAQRSVAKSVSTMNFVYVLAQLLGMSVSGWLVSRWGWSSVFWVSLFAAFAGSLFVIMVKDHPGRSSVEMTDSGRSSAVSKSSVLQRWTAVRQAIRSRALKRASILGILTFASLFATIFGFTPSQAIALGAQVDDLTWLVIAFVAPHAAATIVSHRLFSGHSSPWRSLMVCFAGSALCMGGTIMASNFWVLCAIQVILGALLGIVLPLLMQLAVDEAGPEERASVMGIFQASQAIGIMGGPVVCGWVIEAFNESAGFLFVGLMLVSAASLCTVYYKNQSKGAGG